MHGIEGKACFKEKLFKAEGLSPVSWDVSEMFEWSQVVASVIWV